MSNITAMPSGIDSEFVDIMLDLETLGKKPGCKVLAIGATTFNPQTLVGVSDSFYEVISRDNQAGLIEDPDTLIWWEKQSEEARAASFSGTTSLHNALLSFNTWLEMKSFWGQKKIRLWGKGADFDAPILRAAYVELGLIFNWSAHHEMCFRAMYNFWKSDLDEFFERPEFLGEKHTALADSQHQAEHANLIIETLIDIGEYDKIHTFNSANGAAYVQRED